MSAPPVNLEPISRQFRFGGDFVDGVLLKTGHIHDTYFVRTGGEDAIIPFLLQRINRNVFPDLAPLAENVQRVTEHVAEKLAAAGPSSRRREPLRVIPTLAGDAIFRDPEDRAWRAYNFIERTHTVDVVESPKQARDAAWAFGQFQEMLSDLERPRLHETLAHFHDTPRRFAAFVAAVESDACNRVTEAKEEIAFALNRQAMTALLTEALAAGRIPERVTHNDTKINNVLFDTETEEPVCVIDLDTTMPGAAAFDFGDLVRTSTSTSAEDERDLREVQLRLDLFEAIASGFLDAARSFLTPAEVDSLVVGGKLITFETGLRFLADFLQGDVYFKTDRPGSPSRRACAFWLTFSRETSTSRRIDPRTTSTAPVPSSSWSDSWRTRRGSSPRSSSATASPSASP
jgi:hypothetical protein